MNNFKRVHSDLLGVTTSFNNMVVLWDGPGRVIFSFAQRGKSISAHFASNKEGLRHIKQAIDDFCEWIFYICEWCTMILAVIKSKRLSVVRLVEKLDFSYVMTADDHIIYARAK